MNLRIAIARSSITALLAAALLAGCTRKPATPARPTGTPMGLYVQGALAYRDGETARARAALEAALEQNPNLIMARYLLGSIFREQGNYAAAAEQYEKVTELDPYVALNHYNLGVVYQLLNRLQDAAASYLQALQLDPAEPKANMNLGLVYTSLGKPELALPYVQKAVELSPRSAEAHANFGVVLDALGRHGEAETAYRRALELDPDRTETAINLASNLAAQNRYKDALTVYEDVLKKSDSSLVRQRYGYALFRTGRFDQAIAQFNLALRQAPRNYQAFNGIGDAMLAQYHQSAMLDEKKRTGAVDAWRKSLAINADQPRVEALVREYTNTRLFP